MHMSDASRILFLGILCFTTISAHSTLNGTVEIRELVDSRSDTFVVGWAEISNSDRLLNVTVRVPDFYDEITFSEIGLVRDPARYPDRWSSNPFVGNVRTFTEHGDGLLEYHYSVPMGAVGLRPGDSIYIHVRVGIWSSNHHETVVGVPPANYYGGPGFEALPYTIKQRTTNPWVFSVNVADSPEPLTLTTDPSLQEELVYTIRVSNPSYGDDYAELDCRLVYGQYTLISPPGTNVSMSGFGNQRRIELLVPALGQVTFQLRVRVDEPNATAPGRFMDDQQTYIRSTFSIPMMYRDLFPCNAVEVYTATRRAQ